MPIGIDTSGYRGRLPHLSRHETTYFVTFVTLLRRTLPPKARDLVLASCLHDHGTLMSLTCAVVMPDHVHLIVTPYEHTSLGRVLNRIKSASSRHIRQRQLIIGQVWQRESFDRIIRSDENLGAKAEYIANNPVRKGLVTNCEDWPWFWNDKR